MSKLFNWAAARLVAAFALALPLAAMAATPVAVWDGGSADYNFTQLTRGDYTLAQIGQGYSTQAAADGSYLQIGTSNTEAAFTLKKSDGTNMGASTVIIKFENMPANGGSNRALLSFLKNGTFNNVSDIPYPFIGVAEEKNLSWTSSFIWDNGIWDSASNVRTPNAFSAGQHTAALAYSYAAGSAFYVDGVLRGSSSGLRASGYSPLGVAIGGVADSRTSNKFYAMTGMKVTAIAFFADKISDADVASYVFPSDADKLWTATVSANTAWADIAWDGDKAWQADMSEAKVQLTIESGATVTAPASLTVDNLIVSGAGTLTFATGENTVTASGSISAKVTLPANATLKTSGVLRFDSSSNAFAGNSLFEVVSGTAYLNAAACGLSGDITVDAGATLVNLRSSDALNYNANPVTTVRVYGTLDFGSTRWSTRGVARNCYYFYDGAVIKGVGDSNGALDFIEGSTGGAINLEGAVALSATIKTRDDSSNIALTVAEGKTATLNFTSSVIGTGKSFSKAGAGTLKFANNPTFDAGLKVNAGALDFTGVSEVTTKVIYSAAPTSGIDYLQASNWKGTFVADWVGANNAVFPINSYGNANSVVEVTKLAAGYVSVSNANITVVPTVKVSGFMTLGNGYSGKITTLTKLTGSGVFTNTTYSVDVTTLDNFTGTLATLIGTQYTGMQIGTINLSSTPAAGDKIVNITSDSNIGNIDKTKVSVNGVVDDTIALEVKSDGIYVVVPAATVDITIPEVANATVSVTADGVAVTPENGVVTVDIGAAVVVTYTAAEGYQLTGDAISFTASASTTTVDVSSISVAAIVANVTAVDGQTTTPYTSAASAIAAADDGETVTLLEATVTLTEVVAINKSITIMSGNASGTTITGSGLSAYPTLGAADLTLSANVTVSAQLRVLSGEATITHPTGSAPSYRPPSGYMTSSKNNGDDTTTITFYQQVYVIAAGANATLADENGNQLGSYTPVASGDTFVFTVTPAAGCTLVRVTADGAELTPSEGKYSISIGSSNVSIYAVAGAAVVTGGDSDVYCSSLQAAVDAATSGQTVKLLADVMLDSTVVVTNSLTLDLNGFGIAATDARALWIKAGTVSITGEGEISANATENSSFEDTSSVIRVGDSAVNANAASLTIGADVTVSSGHCYGITTFGKNTPGISLVVNGTVAVTGTESAISGNGSSGLASANITVNDGAVVSATADAGIYFPGTGTLSIAGGTITGPTAVYAKCGTINITGGTLTGTAEKSAYAYNGNGLNATGDALVIDTCGYPGNPATVSVTGGTFTSQNAEAVASYKKGDDAKYADDTVNEAAAGFVSGGTFNTAVADTYCAEGFEPTDDGNGTYGVRVDKGWIYEDADFPGYTGSWNKEISYDETTHKAAIEDGATYTASKPSAGQLVTINLELSFDAANSDGDVHEGAKAAVRLGEGDTEGTYVFQLYTTNETGTAAWLNAAASGVTPTIDQDYEFTFVLDMTNKTFTATVDGVALTVAGAETLGFASANASDTVQSIEFAGAGKVSSIIGSYEDIPVPDGFVADEKIGDVTLTAAQAEWLNGQGNYDALAEKIETMSQTALDNAYLLNLNIAGEFSYEFKVTDVEVGDNDVTVTVSLTRTGALTENNNAKPIVGTLKLKGTASLGTEFTELATAAVEFGANAKFGDGATETTVTVDTTETDAKFYLPVIE